MLCPHCNRENEDTVQYCAFCGEKIADKSPHRRHPALLIGLAVLAVLLLGTLAFCTHNADDSPVSDVPAPVFAADFIGLPLSAVTAQFGDDYLTFNEDGGDYLYYADGRTPFAFSAGGPLTQADGAAVQFVQCPPGSLLREDLRASLSFAQLQQLAQEGKLSFTEALFRPQYQSAADIYVVTVLLNDSLTAHYYFAGDTTDETSTSVLLASSRPEDAEGDAGGAVTGAMGSGFQVPEGFVRQAVSNRGNGYLYAYFNEDSRMYITVSERPFSGDAAQLLQQEYESFESSGAATALAQGADWYSAGGTAGEQVFFNKVMSWRGLTRYEISYTYPAANAEACKTIGDTFCAQFTLPPT